MRYVTLIATAAAAIFAAPGCSRSGEEAKAPTSTTSKPLSVVCRQSEESPLSRNASFVFAGGKLTASGAFGEMTLPATRTEQKAEDGGAPMIAIRASGPAEAPMPDKAGLEACLVKAGADPADRDLVAYHVHLCQQEVAESQSPVAIDAEITITVIDAPTADVFIRRGFKEASAPAGGPMTVETLPPLSCEVS